MGKARIDELALTRTLIRNCRRNLWRAKFADATGQKLTGGGLLSRSLALAQLLSRVVLAKDETMVGVLLPPSVAGVLANAALSLLQKTPVNLNYTLSAESFNSCIAQCGIRTVLTSRKVIERFKLEPQAMLCYLEDLPTRVTRREKLLAACGTYLLPAPILERILGLDHIDADQLLTVSFTSGSTGDPKGVMLTHRNVASNIDAVCQVLDLRRSDVALGLMPFFHSYGYTFGLWAGMTLDLLMVLEHNPLGGREVGELCRSFGVTIMLATPSLLRIYVRRCTAEEFASLEIVGAGAEKLASELAQEFENKFGVKVIEAYGTTEMSPLVATNLPEGRSAAAHTLGAKAGTVGRPLPGVSARIIDPDSGVELGADQPGMLLVKGPNMMKGYLGRPDLTAKVIHDGWYVTGDIAKIDNDGFITIVDRQSRFSKIGGEMVSHLKIEEAIAKILGNPEECNAFVTSVSDKAKGERLVVVHEPLPKTTEDIWQELSRSGLPNLWIPSRGSFLEVEQVPKLGTGKPDLKRIKALATAKFA